MSTTSPRSHDRSARSPWALGVATFAGIMLATVGVLQILQGLAAVLEDDVYVAGINYAYEIDLTSWGWIHIVIGAIALATGIGLASGQLWARITGIFLAILGIFANFAFMPYYPFWSLLVIGIYVWVIWALCTQMTEDEPNTQPLP